MSEDAAPGWRIASGFAATRSAATSGNFYALYEGGVFGNADRGLAAAIARAHAPSATPGARDAAQLAVHEFAEGYFAAPRTLSPGRAAKTSLRAVNRWLSGHVQGDASRHLAPVSLSALLFHERRMGMVQIGTCRLFRLRGEALTPLMRAHARPAEGGLVLPSRALGLDHDLALDHAEELAEPGDILVLLAGLDARSADSVYGDLTELLDARTDDLDMLALAALAALEPAPGEDVSVMALRLDHVPRGRDPAADLAGLKLRPPPKQGDVWDGFAIGRTLFRGRYTMLVAAQDTVDNREVALKIPLPSMLQDEIFAAGFMREAWIGSTVRGHNVVRYIELPPERRSSLYLVMPLYHGESLERRLNRAPMVTLPEGLGIAVKLCEAVQDLAQLQIIHRDLKPDNVMLLPKNKVRLLDLGLAYLPGIDAAEAVKPGGTIRYMAPELLQGAPASARTEVYALGVTMYRMFSGGAFPFGQHESLPLARMRPDLPHWLGEVLARALAQKPELRFADCGELAAALQLGVAQGEEKPAPHWHFPVPELQLWRGLAIFFGIGFLILLAQKL
jgi:hypothetical protein